MITSKLKQILIDSGCSFVIYEQDKLANLFTDASNQYDIIGLIIQPNEIDLEVKANAIHEHYNPLTIEIMRQVKVEDSADNNEVALQALLNICKQIIVRLIALAEFKKIMPPVRCIKIPENKYDFNPIGWSMNLDLYYLLNENRDPCL